MSAPIQPSAPWCPDADFWLGVMRRNGGLVKVTARRLLIKALRDALPKQATVGATSRHYRGLLGRYEAAKARFADAGLLPTQYMSACRSAAKRAGM